MTVEQWHLSTANPSSYYDMTDTVEIHISSSIISFSDNDMAWTSLDHLKSGSQSASLRSTELQLQLWSRTNRSLNKALCLFLSQISSVLRFPPPLAFLVFLHSPYLLLTRASRVCGAQQAGTAQTLLHESTQTWTLCTWATHWQLHINNHTKLTQVTQDTNKKKIRLSHTEGVRSGDTVSQVYSSIRIQWKRHTVITVLSDHILLILSCHSHISVIFVQFFAKPPEIYFTPQTQLQYTARTINHLYKLCKKNPVEHHV